MENLSSPTLIGWRILSSVEEISPGRYAKTQAEKWDSPYSFEYLLLEMMAQTGGLIVGAQKNFQGNVVFAKVENADFQGMASLAVSAKLIVEAFAHDGVSEQGSWIDAQVMSGQSKIAAQDFF